MVIKKLKTKIVIIFLFLSLINPTIMLAESTNDKTIITPLDSLEGFSERYDEIKLNPYPQIVSDNTPVEQWSRMIGVGQVNGGYSVVQTTDGGYMIGGFTGYAGETSFKMLLLKTDERGIQQWVKTYDGVLANTGGAYAMQPTDDGGYILAGWTGVEKAPFSYKLWLVKTDSEGTMEWNHMYGYSGWSYAVSVRQTRDGGYVAAGYHGAAGWILKIDAQGHEQWNTSIPDSTIAYSVWQTNEDRYIVTGYYFPGVKPFIMYLCKLDNSGNIIWKKDYRGRDTTYGRDILQTINGGYLICGSTMDENKKEIGMLIQTDLQGTIIKEQRFDTDGKWCSFSSFQQMDDGGYIIVGILNSNNSDLGTDVWLVRIDETWTEMWEAIYGTGLDIVDTGADNSYVYKIADGGFILSGSVRYRGFVPQTILLIKLAEEHSFNRRPKPPTLSMDSFYTVGETAKLSLVTTDPDINDVSYYIDWGDNQSEDWFGPFYSNENINAYHIFEKRGRYNIRVRAMDTYNEMSDWSDIIVVASSPSHFLFQQHKYEWRGLYPQIAISLKNIFLVQSQGRYSGLSITSEPSSGNIIKKSMCRDSGPAFFQTSQSSHSSVNLSDEVSWIHYDDGVNVNSFRWNGGGEQPNMMEWGIRLTSDELAPFDGATVTTIRHYHGWSGDPRPFVIEGEIRVYDARTPVSRGNLLTSEPFRVVNVGWSNVDLTHPVMINASKDLWVCLYVENYTGFPAGVAKGPTKRMKSSWVTSDDIHWEQLMDAGYHYTWNLWVGVSNLTI